ncbi:MAG: LytTR family DNA-binding domain-containing protein [Pseudomonadota bacterium]
MNPCTALVADDEPLLRDRLVALLQRNWPELEVVATARNGREAVELFDEHAPQVVFLDVHMPGMNGIDAARCIGERAAVVFVTAHEQYAVEAFRQGAIDYIVKPLDEARLQDTVRRLRARLDAPATPGDGALTAEVFDKLSAHIKAQIAPARYLQWIKASVGSTVRLIPVDQVRYLKSDTKYTLVVWEGGEALIRRTIRELADELDPTQFLQIHRSAIVNLHHVQQFSHGSSDGGEVQIKGGSESLPVSRSFVHLFRQM